MKQFKALRIPVLTEEIAGKLEGRLNDLHGVKRLNINLDTQELDIIFDETQLSFQSLVQEMAEAGCPLQHIDIACFIEVGGLWMVE